MNERNEDEGFATIDQRLLWSNEWQRLGLLTVPPPASCA